MQGVCTSHGVVDAKPTYRGGAVSALHCTCGLECRAAYDEEPRWQRAEDVVPYNDEEE